MTRCFILRNNALLLARKQQSVVTRLEKLIKLQSNRFVMLNIRERVKYFDHPVAIERWRAFLFDNEIKVSRTQDVQNSVFLVVGTYLMIDELSLNIIQALAFLMVSINFQFLLYYRRNVEPRGFE